jgi:hypothetical protein
MTRKKHEPFKNIRTKDQYFKYFLFEIDRGRTRETFIHIETKTIFNDDEYILDKMTQIQKYYDPQMIEVEISPLGKWEYNALKEKGLKSLFENVV